jgi:pyridoxamine---pyruvate transaminase
MSNNARAATFTYTGGPVAASPRTLAGLGRPIPFGYDPAYLRRFKAVERKVARVYETEQDIVLMQGEAVLGHAQMTERVFRLGRMGPASRSLNPVVALSTLGRGLADFGVAVEIGAGVEATLEVLKEPVEARAVGAPAR